MTDNYAQKTDEELMLAYQEGDSRAFDEIYDRTADTLYGYLQRRIQSKDFVDDIFQVTFAKFHQTRLQYRPPLPVLPWLFTICRTVTIDALRKKAKERETSDVDMDLYQGESSIEGEGVSSQDSPFPEGLVGLKTLSPPQKEALTLRYVHDLSFEDIAKRLETTPTNARQLVSRAIKKLKTFTQKKAGIHD